MATRQRTPRRWGPIVSSATAIVALGAITAGAVLSDGYDAQEVPRLETTVWVTRDDGRYARVNTDLAEIDTVRNVADPSDVFQHGSHSVVFTQGFSQAWAVDGAFPRDLVESGDGGAAAVAAPTPGGTDHVASAGSFLVYLTSTGEVHLGQIPSPGATEVGAFRLNPFAGVEVGEDEEPPTYIASAAAVNEDGVVAIYSHVEQAVRIYRTLESEFDPNPILLPEPPADDESLTMTYAGDRWVIHSPATGRVWAQGLAGPITTGLDGDARLQATPSPDAVIHISDAAGMVAVDVLSGDVTREIEASGTPAAPVLVDGRPHGAWISTTGGALWAGQGGFVALDVPAGVLDDDLIINPTWRTNGDRAVLTETATGLIWLSPSGQLISSEAWEPLDEDDEVEGTVHVDDIVEQEPPVAEPDHFGVRRGALVLLPLLYNDHDPNKRDVLTIDPSSLGSLAAPSFGELGLVSDDQQAVVRVAAASGSTTFTYSAHDGSAASAPASVTLTVVPDDVNSAPVWCGVENCTQVWPSPQIAPGGYATVPVLNGWVDPEGDVMALTDARLEDLNAPLSVVPTADGQVALRHLDPNAGESEYTVIVTVTDAFGASAEMPLVVRVTASPALEAKPIALSAAAGESRRVEIADHVIGGSGSYRLIDAIPSQTSPGLQVTPNAASGVVEVSADQPGFYQATYTVEDTVSLVQQTATLRVTVSPSGATIALPPLVAFVRPQEDATLDVLATAHNTTGRVLMVSQVRNSTPNLQIAAVGETYVRVSGSTDDGQPGLIGTAEVVVTDGGSLAAVTQISVFLLPADHQRRPIAVPDALSVRAGSQIDIPVLANDVSPRGERLMLLSEVEGTGTPGELAFASGSVVRYLAPDVPGVYTLHYTTYLESAPTRMDTAPITITVVAPGSNRAPEPRELVARVLAGQAVSIPFSPHGIDPDGDEVYLSDVSQPAAGLGVASINAAGDAIIFRAPVAGAPGVQLSFEYTVTDSWGATATGTVKVGVLSADSASLEPVTYSDYVATQMGAEFPFLVNPLANDRDPMRGTLNLIDLRPNAPEGSSEYDRLASLIDASTSFEDGIVALRAGTVEGSHSYVYMVESELTKSTATGFIVVSVRQEAAPDQLTVADTVLTAGTRHDLTTGIDVLDGKVQWQSGDLSSLRVEVWGDAAVNFSASGSTIRGPLPTERTIIPFSVTGTDFAGNEVQTFAFVRVPSFQDLRLQRRAGLTPFEVEEEQSISVDIREVIDVGATDIIELRSDSSYVVQRDNAVCSATGTTTITYSAGREAPWSDTCAVPVRLQGQDTWSMVAVPFTILPLDPEAILIPASRTIIPGETITIPMLDELVAWEGGRVGDLSTLNLATSYGGASFTVTQSGSDLTIQARADARPGTRETVTVSSAAYGGLTTAVSLVVGPAAPDAPRGATFSFQCDVSRGSSCTVPVTGVSGEYDPFFGVPGAGLTVVNVGTSGSVVCPVATVTQAGDTSLVATWPAGPRPNGGECVVDFTVADAQGRTGSGTVTLDILGFPPAPTSLMTQAFTADSVTLTVNLGNAASAHPALTGVAIYEGGVNVGASCVPGSGGNYRCTVSGLVHGEKHYYTARAVNSVGESLDTTVHETWAFDVPEASNLVVTPTSSYPATPTTGHVEIKVDLGPTATGFAVVVDGSSRHDFARGPGVTTTVHLNLGVGPHSFDVTPTSTIHAPAVGGPPVATLTADATVVGAPFFTGDVTASGSLTEITFSGPSLNANYAPSSQVLYVVWQGGSSNLQCTQAGSTLDAHVPGASTTKSTSPTISGLSEMAEYNVGVCGMTDWGVVRQLGGSKVLTWVDPGVPEGTLTYTIASTPTTSNEGANIVWRYSLTSSPTVTNKTGYVVRWFLNDADAPDGFRASDLPGVFTVKYCAAAQPGRCGAAAQITPTGAPSPVTVSVPQCPFPAAPQDSDITASGPGGFLSPYSNGVDTYSFSFSGPYSVLAGDSHHLPQWCLDLYPDEEESP